MARVTTHADWIDLGLPGRKSAEIVSGRTGSTSATVRYVEILTAKLGDPPRPMHRHRGVEEIIWVLDGEGVFETPAGIFPIHSGCVIHVPADEPHVTRNMKTDVLRLMCFFPHPDVGRHTEEPAQP